MDVIDSFLDLKQAAKPVMEVYGEHSELVLLSELGLKAIFRKGRVRGDGGQPDRKDGWQQFRELHPKSKGILEVSRPAYSADGMECLIEVGQQFDWLAGSGAAYQYALQEGCWKKVAEVGTWIS